MTDLVRDRKDKAVKLAACGQMEEALTECQQVLEQVPEDLTSRRMVAELFQKMGRRKEALATYEVLADAWARRGWLLRAIALCKIILQIEPRHERTQQLLAQLYARGQSTQPTPMAPATPTVSPPPAPIEPTALVARPGAGRVPHFPVFSQLGGEEFLSLLEGLEMRFCAPGETIIQEGKPSTSMFAIVEGSVEVVRTLASGKERTVAVMGGGNLFGEMALGSEGNRRSLLRAREHSVLLELTRSRVEQLVVKYPAVGQVLQTFHRERLLNDMLSSHPLFRTLSLAQRVALALEFELDAMPADKVLISQRKPVDALYVLLRGRCRVSHQRADGSEVASVPLQEGDLFGEISLLLGTNATATVTTDTACTLLKLSHEACQAHLLNQPELRDQLSRLGAERLVARKA